MKYIIRLITLPLILGLSLVYLLRAVLTLSRDYLLYGGELVRYNKETNSKTLYECWTKMNADGSNI